jgi:hypothetical protein
MTSAESLRQIGAICVQNNLPGGSPSWLAKKIGKYLDDRGDFSFIKCDTSRCILENGFRAVCEANGWAFLKTFDAQDKKFAFSPQLKELDKINFAIVKYYPDHCELTYAWTMRQMQFIAQNGWIEYKTRMTEK